MKIDQLLASAARTSSGIVGTYVWYCYLMSYTVIGTFVPIFPLAMELTSPDQMFDTSINYLSLSAKNKMYNGKKVLTQQTMFTVVFKQVIGPVKFQPGLVSSLSCDQSIVVNTHTYVSTQFSRLGWLLKPNLLGWMV